MSLKLFTSSAFIQADPTMIHTTKLFPLYTLSPSIVSRSLSITSYIILIHYRIITCLYGFDFYQRKCLHCVVESIICVWQKVITSFGPPDETSEYEHLE